MGRLVPISVFQYVLLAVTLAVLAAPPLFLAVGTSVLAADPSGHSCGGG